MELIVGGMTVARNGRYSLTVILLVSVCLAIGCGKKSKSSSSSTSAAPSPATPAAPAQNTAAPGGGDVMVPGHHPDRGFTDASGGAAPQEETPARPEDVSEWTKEDFASARVERDQNLLNAILEIEEKRLHEPKMVAMLVALLAIDEPAPPENTQEAGGGPQGAGGISGLGGGGFYGPGGGMFGTGEMIQVDPGVATAIIESLGLSEAAEATEALLNILTGQQEVPLEFRQTVDETIRALAGSINVEREKILFEVLTKSEMVKPSPAQRQASSDIGAAPGGRRRGGRSVGISRGPGYFGGVGGGVDAELERIEQLVLTEAGPYLSVDFRSRMAEYLDDPKVSSETAQKFEQFLIQDDPRNLIAQVVLYQNPHTEEQIKDQVEQILLDGSQQAMLLLTGLPESSGDGIGGGRRFGASPFGRGGGGRFNMSGGIGRGSGRGGRPSRNNPGALEIEAFDPEKHARHIARLIWTNEFVAKVRPQLGEGVSGQGSSMPQLIASIPLETARNAFTEHLRDQNDGTNQSFNNMDFLNGAAVDPGALISFKQVYHRPDKIKRKRSRGNQSEQNEQVDPVEQQWTQQVEQYVGRLFSSLRRASRSNRIDDDRDDQSDESDEDEVDRPISVHSERSIVAEYRIRWPDDVDSSWAGVALAPLDLYYVRIEEENRPDVIMRNYRRQAGPSMIRRLNDGAWIDGFDKERLVSRDIWVTARGGVDRQQDQSDGSRPGAQKMPLIIEILQLRISEPEPEAESEKKRPANGKKST